MLLASAPSLVYTSTKTTAPRRMAGFRSRRGVRAGVPSEDQRSDFEGVAATGVEGAEGLSGMVAGMLFLPLEEYGIATPLLVGPEGRLGATREVLKLRFLRGVGEESSAGFKGTLVVGVVKRISVDNFLKDIRLHQGHLVGLLGQFNVFLGNIHVIKIGIHNLCDVIPRPESTPAFFSPEVKGAILTGVLAFQEPKRSARALNPPIEAREAFGVLRPNGVGVTGTALVGAEPSSSDSESVSWGSRSFSRSCLLRTDVCLDNIFIDDHAVLLIFGKIRRLCNWFGLNNSLLLNILNGL
ncbi:hypothetical protein HG531_012729 [Fusarium graminearum]|nr:hypothetical protein HG531_012729 [Fusarium graminearum]